MITEREVVEARCERHLKTLLIGSFAGMAIAIAIYREAADGRVPEWVLLGAKVLVVLGGMAAPGLFALVMLREHAELRRLDVDLSPRIGRLSFAVNWLRMRGQLRRIRRSGSGR